MTCAMGPRVTAVIGMTGYVTCECDVDFDDAIDHDAECIGRMAVEVVELVYDAADPHAVSLVAYDRDDAAERTPVRVFSRDLLAHGLNEVCGEGTVSVGPDASGWVVITLNPNRADRTPSYAPRVLVEDFLRRTYDLVPADADPTAALDAELLALLGGAA